MPVLPNVSKVIRLEYLFELADAVPALSRQFWHYSGSAPVLADMQVFADNAVAAFTTSLIDEYTAEKTFLGCQGTDLSSASGAQALSAVSVPGLNGGNPLPQDVAFICAYQIGRRYRGGHARGYWPFGGTPDLIDPRTWDPGIVSGYTSDLVSLKTGVAAGGWSGAGTLTQVNVSYYHGFDVVTNPTTGRARNVPRLRGAPLVDNVVQYVGRPLIGSQRRRIGR